MTSIHAVRVRQRGALLYAALTLAGAPAYGSNVSSALNVKLSEWKVELSEPRIPAGSVTFTVTNAGSIPHAFEVEGQGIEKETPQIQPGATATLTLTLKPGRYEVYCPVGDDSHKKLGMEADLEVESAGASTGSAAGHAGMDGASSQDMHQGMEAASGHDTHQTREGSMAVQAIRVTGGGPVIQILPGPFPFPDSAGPILQAFGEEHEALESQAQNGPYSNNVAPATGSFTFTAWDKGPVRDSVDGTALVTTRDGTRWKLVIDRVFTKDVPHHPKFGGVIMGLYYHGATQVHTPLVPTINSAVALWALGHLYRNDTLVTDNAMVHVMLLSRTRRDGDFALACWDCSRNKIEELQLQVTSAPGEPKFDAPGGFLFVNWEQSRADKPTG
jgi:plastocyanin